ncbi:Peptide methionine sulfoxide reductase B2, chloroplastic [Hypsizygus marmoreus]|uniref:Peptide-methionine (R)-S-oxide reductase n=1 Tax=Hypsizygus marmoreus TaxID=39966 RepID=A0A369JWP7_HYPMA|nr:Peptide methionine sulfoxide reductase B2, chloroplastic [Hypsizygus marmoreus]
MGLLSNHMLHIGVVVNHCRRFFYKPSTQTSRFLSRRLFPSPSSQFLQCRTMTSVQKSESEWRAVLAPEQFRVLRLKGTEPPGTGEYDKHKAEGIYTCAGCGTPLYKSTTKFNSGCGWPAFFDDILLRAALPGAVTRHEDISFGQVRTEIVCTACGGHLGHVFKGEGFPTPTDERHCVNSISLKFKDEQ